MESDHGSTNIISTKWKQTIIKSYFECLQYTVLLFRYLQKETSQTLDNGLPEKIRGKVRIKIMIKKSSHQTALPSTYKNQDQVPEELRSEVLAI